MENSQVTGGKEKQKIIVVAVLGVVIVGVGAFQFMGGGSPEPQKAAKKSETASKSQSGDEPVMDEKKVELTKLITGSLPARDPFRPSPIEDATDPVALVAPPSPQPAASPPRGPRPSPMAGGVAPMNPMGSLPAAMPNGAIGAVGGTPVALQPGAPLRQPGEPAYSVAGVVIGKERMVVLQDDNGNQRLLKVGESLDGNTKVVSVEKGKVKVRAGGKTVELQPIPKEAPAVEPGSAGS